jgi:hypothetical protein
MIRFSPPGGATLICGAPLTNPPRLRASRPPYSRHPYRSHTCSALFHFCPLSRCCATRPVERVPTSSPSIRLTVTKSPSRSLSQTSMAMPIMLAVMGRPSSFARVRSICNSARNLCCVITGTPEADGERHSSDKALFTYMTITTKRRSTICKRVLRK